MDFVGKAKEVNQRELVGSPSSASDESRAAASEGKLHGLPVKAVDGEKVIPPPGEQLSLNPVASSRDKQYDKSAYQYQITESDNGISDEYISKAGSSEEPIKLNDSASIAPILREGTGYHGIQTFRIENFAKRRADAAKGIETYVDSEPFYAGEKGYKLCTRFYPNGVNFGKNTHVSVGICLMKGEHDDMLSWPFTRSVNFMLVDQADKEHIIDGFCPATYSKHSGAIQVVGLPDKLSPAFRWHKSEIAQTVSDLDPFKKPQNQ